MENCKMTKLTLGPITEDKPVQVTIDLPGALHRDLVAYAAALARENGQPTAEPTRLLVPMLDLSIATNRGFAKVRRALRYVASALSPTDPQPPPATIRSDAISERESLD